MPTRKYCDSYLLLLSQQWYSMRSQEGVLEELWGRELGEVRVFLINNFYGQKRLSAMDILKSAIRKCTEHWSRRILPEVREQAQKVVGKHLKRDIAQIPIRKSTTWQTFTNLREGRYLWNNHGEQFLQLLVCFFGQPRHYIFTLTRTSWSSLCGSQYGKARHVTIDIPTQKKCLSLYTLRVHRSKTGMEQR